jgi:tetratricopeptide (TPR) repeat protein
LGKPKAAIELLARAIEANPRLTGAYKDLGDLYLQDWDMERAWRCWDIARGIAPSHPLLRGVADYEQMLLERYLEYFEAPAKP